MSIYECLQEAIAAERPVSLAVVVQGARQGERLLVDPAGDRLGTLGLAELDQSVAADALVLLEREQSELRRYQVGDQEVEVFIESYPSPPHLIIVGAVHIAIPLCRCAKEVGYRVTVVDPRGLFATPERFGDADALVVDWPEDAFPQLRIDRSTYIAILTHDPKLDDPAIRLALQSPARYIGAIGSRKTQAARRAKLQEEGVPEEQIARIRGPIGLPLGGRSPGEIAISILAEMIAARYSQTTPWSPA